MPLDCATGWLPPEAIIGGYVDLNDFSAPQLRSKFCMVVESGTNCATTLFSERAQSHATRPLVPHPDITIAARFLPAT
jgi:hypothetical protein